MGQPGRVVATDILEMTGIRGVEFVQGDFREEEVFNRILALVPERAVDVVLSDMAPNMSGMDVIDHAKSSYLGELALDMAERVLKPHGHALIKVFQGASVSGAGEAVPQQICPGEAAEASRVPGSER